MYEPLISQLAYNCYSSTRIALALKKPTKVDLTLIKEAKPNEMTAEFVTSSSLYIELRFTTCLSYKLKVREYEFSAYECLI